MATKQEKLEAIEKRLAEIKRKALGIQETAEEEFGITPTVPTAPTEVGVDLVIEDQPGIAPDITTARGRLAAASAEVAATERAQIEAKEARDKAREEAAKKEKTLFEKLLAKPTTEEKRLEEFADIGIDPKEFFAGQETVIAEIESLMKDYDARVIAKDSALLGAETRLQGYPGGILRGEKALIQKQFNIELSQMSANINTKMAIFELKKGNFEQARSFVREAVNDYVFDLKLEYSQFESFREMNREALDELDIEYQDALDRAEDTAEKHWNEAKEQAERIGNLMLETNGEAGITFEDSIEEATEKAASWLATQPEKGTVTKQLYDEAVKAGYTKDFTTFLQERGILEVKGPTIPGLDIPGLEGVDLNTTGGALTVFAKFGDYGSTFAYYDDNTKLTTTAIALLLNDAGIFSASDKAGALADLIAQIDDYKVDWASRGDDAGTREDFAQKAAQFFPEFTEEEILKYVFQEVTNEWLGGQKPATEDEGGFWDFLPFAGPPKVRK